MRQTLLLLFFLIFCVIVVKAQTGQEAFARIMDAQTRQPVSYATIQFENSDNGIIANEDGDFRIPYELVEQNIGLIISSIGYTTVRLQASRLQPNIVNSIFLNPKVEELEMVVLQSKKSNKISGNLEPTYIISRAISTIQNNYPTKPHSFLSYYRDYQMVNNSYYNLNEGILEVFDKGYNTVAYDAARTRAALYFYDLNDRFYVDSTLINATYGDSKTLDLDGNVSLETKIKNELELLNIHNPIRNFDRSTFSFIYELRSDFVVNHNFTLRRVVYEDDEPLFEITFVTKDSELTEYVGEGRIFISQNSYAIHRLDYQVYSNPNYSTFGTVNTSLSNTATQRKGSDRVVFFEVSVAYKRKGELMYPNYITFNNRFVLKGNDPFQINDMQLDPDSKAVLISFNKPLDPTTIGNMNNYRFKYKGSRLIVKSVEQKSDNELLVRMVNWDLGSSSEELKSEDFDIRIKRIRDMTGAKLNQSIKVTGYQFREIFTQEVFEQKEPEQGLKFVEKSKSLLNAPINQSTIDLEKYWVNSPLKKTED